MRYLILKFKLIEPELSFESNFVYRPIIFVADTCKEEEREREATGREGGKRMSQDLRFLSDLGKKEKSIRKAKQ